MKVILKKDIHKLGDEGQIVTVKNGYGRNFLIPQGLARLATDGAIREHEEMMRQASRRIAQRNEENQKLAEDLGKVEVVVEVKVGEENRIFGTVTPTQVAVQLAKQGFDIDRRRIDIVEEIKVLGVYTASLKLTSEITAEVKVRVEPMVEETEA
ncbi:MAG: 50S ribosomal protein L9 [Rhodothermales bacterium]